MNRQFRLGTVLRARQAQKDAARGAVMLARAEVAKAAREAEARQDALRNAVPGAVSARALSMSLSLRRMQAARVMEARAETEQAEQVVTERLAEWGEAAGRHRSVERLAERHQDRLRRADEEVEQKVIDDLATTAAHQNSSNTLSSIDQES